MANRLTMAVHDTILQLHSLYWSARRIARELGIDRATVSRHLRRARSGTGDDFPAEAAGRANAATFCSPPAPAADGAPERGGATTGADANAAISPAGSEVGIRVTIAATGPAPAGEHRRTPGAGRPRLCEPYRQVILAKREQGLSAQRIYQDLTAEHGYCGSYDSVKRFVRRFAAGQPLPARRLECAPGFEVQVDYGTGRPVRDAQGKQRRTHVFRVVLSHSRKGYSEVSFRQTTDDFLHSLENAFWHFGGVPQTVVIDNLKAAVKHPDWYDPELQPKLRAFCAHYGIVILPTRPRTPRHKGKIERGIAYVKGNALRGRAFDSLAAQNDHLAQWEATVADKRIHGTTRQQVGQLFGQVERQALRPLPAEQFPFFQEAQRIVNRDGHVEVARAYYSVPPEHLGRTVWVRWDARLVRVFNQRMEQIALHARHQQGRFSTDARHIAAEKISGLERGATWLLNKVRLVGPRTAAWAEALLTARGIEGTRVLLGLIALTKRHSGAALERACDTALSHGEFRLRAIRALLARQPERAQAALPFLEEHPLIRPLDDYARVVASALERQGTRQRVTRDAAPRERATVRLTRHDSGVPCRDKEPDPGRANDQGPGASGTRQRSGYSSPGCAPAGPDSASPDSSSLRPPFPPSPGEISDDE